MTEHDIQNTIRIKLSKLGYCVFRINTGKFKLQDGRWFDVGVPKGFTDLIAIKDGKIAFIEVKAENGKASKEQLDFIRTMRNKYGCCAGIVRNMEDVKKILNKMERSVLKNGTMEKIWINKGWKRRKIAEIAFKKKNNKGRFIVFVTNIKAKKWK